MGEVLICGTMDLHTVGTGLKIKLMEEVSMNGLMEEDLMVSGKTITCTGKVTIPGRTVEATMVNT